MKGATTPAVMVKKTGVRGHPCGTSHWNVRWPDELVRRAQELHAAGVSVKAIVRELGGPARWTVRRWLDGTRRRPPARVVVRRVSAEERSARTPAKTGPSDEVSETARKTTHKNEQN